MNVEKELESVWHSNPETIRQFLEQRPDYEQLCAEIAYILRKRLSQADIEISTVTNRAKTLKSFLEKITRKEYSKPFIDITDFAGVRVVYLYEQDLNKIESIIKKEFTIIEKVDKLNEKGSDRFGYGAIHYIIKLGKNSSGARYDDLKNLLCEIQVRTVLQDAWAIIDHHLVYKRESDIPSNLQRKLNSLAGLFETADNQFEAIRQEREKYLGELDESIESESFLTNELNLDTFTAYIKWKFPDNDSEYFKGQVNAVYTEISKAGMKDLTEIDKIIEKYKTQILMINQICIDKLGTNTFKGNEMPSSIIVLLILEIESEELRKISGIDDRIKEALKELKT
jgi:putative GTP pyrophosphokinase